MARGRGRGEQDGSSPASGVLGPGQSRDMLESCDRFAPPHRFGVGQFDLGPAQKAIKRSVTGRCFCL